MINGRGHDGGHDEETAMGRWVTRGQLGDNGWRGEQ